MVAPFDDRADVAVEGEVEIAQAAPEAVHRECRERRRAWRPPHGRVRDEDRWAGVGEADRLSRGPDGEREGQRLGSDPAVVGGRECEGQNRPAVRGARDLDHEASARSARPGGPAGPAGGTAPAARAGREIPPTGNCAAHRDLGTLRRELGRDRQRCGAADVGQFDVEAKTLAWIEHRVAVADELHRHDFAELDVGAQGNGGGREHGPEIDQPSPGRRIGPGHLDVEGLGEERAAHGAGVESRERAPIERRQRRGVRRRGGSAEETRKAVDRGRDTVGGRELGLLAHDSPGGGEIVRRRSGQEAARGGEEDPPRPVGAERLALLAGVEAEGKGSAGLAGGVAVSGRRGGDRQRAGGGGVPAQRACRRLLELAAEADQIQQPAGASGAHHHEPLSQRCPRTEEAHDLDRIVVATAAVLGVVREAHDRREIAREHVEVVVVRRRAERIGPVQDHSRRALQHQVRDRTAAEVEELEPGQRRQRGTGDEIPLPGARSTVGQIPFIPGRREVEHPLGGDLVHRRGDVAVLERRLDEVDDVIDDHLTAARGEVEDVLREPRHAAEGGGETERGARREVVDDLEHGGAFVAPPLFPRQDIDRRQLAGRLRVGERLDAVGERADLAPAAVEAPEIARRDRPRARGRPAKPRDG